MAFTATSALAAGVDTASLNQLLVTKMASISAILSSKGLAILGVLATLQFVMTNYGLLKSGADIEAITGKLIASVLWICVCVYILMNGPEFISKVGNEFMNIPGLALPNVGTIMANTATTAAAIAALIVPVGFVSNSIGTLLVYFLLFVVALGCFFAFKIFMIQLELGIIIMMAPLSFAFLGMNALKDQGIAPFKSLISLVYRVVLVGLILSAFSVVDDSMREAFGNLSGDDFLAGVGTLLQTIVSGIGAYLLLAYLLFKSDAIAATLAAGTTNMGTADVASAAAAGAALGAAVATGGASAATAAGKGGQSMTDFMKSMGSSAISNAGQQGVGGLSKPDAVPSAASLASQSGGKGAAAPSGAGSASATGNGGPNPRARAAPGGVAGEGRSAGGVLGMGSSAPGGPSDAVAKAGAQVPEATTSVWQDSGDAASQVAGSSSLAGGAMDMPGSGTSGPRANGSPTSASSRSGDSPQSAGATPSDMASGDSFGADLKKEMSQSQTAEMAQQTTPRKPAATSGESAAIGGGDGYGADLKKEMARLADAQAKQSAPGKPTLSETWGAANRQVAEEKGTTQVSINANAAD